VTLNVTLDRTKPKFLQFNPTDNAFVRGPIVPISVEVDEANVREWRVQVNNQDIPNNTGSTQEFTVNWDTSGIELDGPQTITVRVKDEADNETTQTISVTLDRVSPVLTIQYPQQNTVIRRRSTVSVVVDLTDLSTQSIDVTGIDVLVKSLDGNTTYLRVARSATRTSGNNTLRWSGRIRWRYTLPTEYKIVATARDKAGNVAAIQEVTVRPR
jgi:Flp pilus assembly protein TadG